jgi:hypothetical protein
VTEYPKLPEAPTWDEHTKRWWYGTQMSAFRHDIDRDYRADCATAWKAIALEAMKYGEHKLPCLATDDATNPACKVVPCHCGWSALQAHVEGMK